MFENLVIVGSATGEAYMSPPGDLRAYDIVTGKLAWQFHTVPQPGEFGYETWPKDAWKYIGGTNTWGEITIDAPRGIAYFPTGSGTYDFYGADRVGANLFADCLLALDARTGKRIWHYQTVHHDLWDYDNTSAPQVDDDPSDGNNEIHAYDASTGGELWKSVLGAPTTGSGAMYELNGRQYLLVTASGENSRANPNLPRGYVAFALPAKRK